ncbi:hypothetical protein [Mucilaginibacter sp.]|uniref:hypothetical protein n=1 Tax=Mucilaginibacter sp. TaxID=1882438 RepID=UPI003262EA8D
MKFFYSLALFLLSVSSFTYAQTNFKPGYILNLKGDTIRGNVDAREWDINPDIVVFRSNTDGQEKTYTPKDINGFGVAGNVTFEKFELPISLDNIDPNKASVHIRVKTEVRTVFLKVVTTGTVLNLYSYTDLIKPRFIILDNATKHAEELIYHVFTDENVSFIRWVPQYRVQLQAFAEGAKVDNASFNKTIENSRYQEIEIANIVRTINKDKGPVFTAEKLFTTRFFVGASYVKSSLSYELNTPVKRGTEHDSGIKIDAGIDLIFNKKKGDAFFRVEVGYNENHFNFLLQDNSFVSRDFFVNYKTISLQPQFIYNVYSKDNLKVFIDVGFIYNKYQFKNYSIYKNGSNPPELQHPGTLDFSNSTARLLLKAGVVVAKHFELNAGYVTKSELPGSNSSRFDTGAYQAGVNFLF